MTEDEVKTTNIEVVKVDEKKPKKRGRKPKPKKTPKKRGRKKKVVKTTEDNKKTVETAVKIPKKRGRKPTSKLVSMKKEELRDLENNDDYVVAHIPIRMNDVIMYNKKKNNTDLISTSEDLTSSLTNISFESIYDSKAPIDENSKNSKYTKYLEEDNEKLKKKIEQLTNKLNGKNDRSSSSNYNIQVLDSEILTFDDENNVKFKMKTDTCCKWCIHKFDNVPFPYPHNYDHRKGIFKVSGFFCSPNCAMAYNLDSKDVGNIKKRNSLIFRLYNTMLNTKVDAIFPSQPRDVLDIFEGGTVSIEEFRHHNLEICNSRVILPPMVPVKTLIEESYKDRNKYKWDKMDIEYNRYNKLKNNIKLKRSKPTKNSNNSLFKTMKIRKIKISD